MLGRMIEEAELRISAELGRLSGVLHASNHGRERRGSSSLEMQTAVYFGISTDAVQSSILYS